MCSYRVYWERGAMRDYKGWTSAQRSASLQATKKAIELGEIPSSEKLGCHRCKQKVGVIDYHNHNYSHPTKYLEPLCYSCHMVVHNFHNNPQGCMEYWEKVWMGFQAPPVIGPQPVQGGDAEFRDLLIG